ncbi:TetR/AcrR family transcriptional regulator [Streptomyces sp. DSM 44915]|uniref:TetR/AcrR family transcriptional regulator n=1 Tax=Streptomyces chisholmiae TaxID=3075540 RepID=A0ABU2JUN4_9ACTN|nr:TetR/AcrR family transcriptional regulator [Streptomyces sp. DSM 44915]MDT0268682.1 TetR/AcrR family transcriptional regulator [Streptomyces sp. DSM 44915]
MPRQTDTRTRARDEFARRLTEHGYLGVSLDDIAKAVDVRKASLYHHFPGGKPALFMAVAAHHTEEAAAVLAHALATPGTLRDRLLALAASYAQGTYNSALSHQIYYGTRYLDDAQRAEISHAYVHGLIQPVTDLMAQAVETGELRQADPEFLATAFMELAATVQPVPEDIALPKPSRATPAPADRLARDVVDLFLRGAAPDGA